MQITDHIPNLVGGITQQPPETRIKTAVDEMVNAYPSAIQGLSKRRGAEFVASLTSTALGTTSFMHTIDRDELEKYFAVVNSDGTVEVYDLNGNQQSVTMDADAVSYLTTVDPSVSIRGVTVGDYTFLANREKTVQVVGGLAGTPQQTTHQVKFDKFLDPASHYDDGGSWSSYPGSPRIDLNYYRADLTLAHERTLADGSTETFYMYPNAGESLTATERYLPSERTYSSGDYSHVGYSVFSGPPIVFRWFAGRGATQDTLGWNTTSVARYNFAAGSAQSNSGILTIPVPTDNSDGVYSTLVSAGFQANAVWTGGMPQVSSSMDGTPWPSKYLLSTTVASDTNADYDSAYGTPTDWLAYGMGVRSVANLTNSKWNAPVSYNDIVATRTNGMTFNFTDSDGVAFSIQITYTSVSTNGEVITFVTDTPCYVANATETLDGTVSAAEIIGQDARANPDTTQAVRFVIPDDSSTSGMFYKVTIGIERELSNGSIEVIYRSYSAATIAALLALIQAGFSGSDSEGNAYSLVLSASSYDAPTNNLYIVGDAPFFLESVVELKNGDPVSSTTADKQFSYRRVVDYDDLPDRGKLGELVHVTGQNDTGEDDYYVEWTGQQWEEALGYGASESLDPKLMPQVLIRNSNGSWELKPHSWSSRLVGDAESNQTPSFVTKKINDMFLFQGRLGICAGESIVLSEVDFFEQFYRSTCVQLEDDNRIDVELNFGRVEKPHAALAVQDNLLLFSDKGQFRLYSGSGVLTPKTATVIQIGDYVTSSSVRPHAIGKSAFFTAELGGYTVAREFFLGAATDDRLLSSELTIQCPQYVTGNARYIQTSRDHKAIFVLSRDDPQAIYVYKFEYDGEQKIQSAWCKWDLGVGSIESIGLYQNYLYIISSLGSERELTRIDIRDQQDIPGTELLRLDMQVIPTATYDAATDETRLLIPFDQTAGVEVWDLTNGHTIPVERTASNGDLYVAGDYTSQVTGGTLVVGKPYTMDVKLSTIYRRGQKKPEGEIVLTDGRLTVNYINIAYTDTVAFTVETSSRGRATKTYNAGPKQGYVDVKYGEVPKTSGHLRVPIMTRNDNAEIRIKNDTPFASNILHVDWFGKHNPRARRV